MPNLMIVDDEETIRLGLSQLVRRLAPQWEVTAICSDVEEARASLRRRLPDAVLVDIEMPGGTGLDLCQELHEVAPYVHKLILTGHNEFAYAQQAIRYGVIDYLLKPLQREELVEALGKIERALDQAERAFDWIADRPADALEDELRRGLHDALEVNAKERFFAVCESWKKDTARAEGSELSAACNRLLSVLLGPEIGRIRSGMGAALQEENGKLRKELNFAATESLRYRLIVRYLERLDAVMVSAPHEPRKAIVTVKQYIHSRYPDQDLGLESAARQVHLNPNYLSELFKEVTGRNFVDYLSEVRMEAAKQLLRETHLKTYEIAERVGYSSSKYFSAIFRKYCGMTPTEYRNRSI